MSPSKQPPSALEPRSAEAALRLSEATRSAILEAALDCIITIDHQGRVIDFNPAAESVFGYSREQALGREMAELIVPHHLRERHRAGMARAISTGQDHIVGRRIEITALRRNGEEFPVELAITRISNHGPPMFTGHIRDITRRKQGEQRQAAQYAVASILAEAKSLEEASSRIIKAVCENLAWDLGVLWEVNPSESKLVCAGIWHDAHPRQEKFEALTRETRFKMGVGLPGRIWRTAQPIWIEDLAHDKNFPRLAIARLEGLRSGFGFPVRLDDQVLAVIEFFSHQPRKPTPELLDMFQAVGSQVGQFIQRKRAEAELRALNLQLEQRVSERTSELHRTKEELQEALKHEQELNRLKSNFVTLVSHQFRTPLGIVLSATDILDAYFDRLPPERRREQLADIRWGTRQMAELLDQVLLLGQMESGSAKCKLTEIDLNQFCRQLTEEMAGTTNNKCPIGFETRVQPAAKSSPALLDETLLRHILANLLTNAVNFSRPGSRVIFTLNQIGKDALFHIRDEGIGIPEEDTTHLFSSFQRGANVGDLPGSGLGLVIVKRCVERLGGTIVVQSRVNQGTEVTVSLPAFVVSSRPPAAKSARLQTKRKSAASKPAKKPHEKNPHHRRPTANAAQSSYHS